MNLLPNVIALVKQAAVEAVEASKPMHLLFGQVICTSPLKIQVDQKTIYTQKMLLLTRTVTDYEVEMTVDGVQQKIQMHNALQVGETVILLRMQGGKKFLIVDRKGG